MAREMAGARPGASYRAKDSAELGLGLGPGLGVSPSVRSKRYIYEH